VRISSFSIVNYWHGIRGGMEIHGKLLAEGLVNRGHTLDIITTVNVESEIERILQKHVSFAVM